MADGEKKEEDKNAKTWISQEQRELFRWNKNILHSFEGLSFGENKKLKIIASSFYLESY